MENQNKDHALDGPQSGLVIHVVQAVEGMFPNKLSKTDAVSPSFNLGFFRVISLLGGGQLQDTLRLLTLWFKYGSNPQVNRAINAGIPTVEVDTWLVVIPQVRFFSSTR